MKLTSAELKINRVSPAETQQNQSSAVLLDVRTPAEFEESHISGSVLHPLGNLNPVEVEKLVAGKSQCVVICQSGKRAARAAEKLKRSSLPDLRVMEGGLTAWEAAGFPLERGKKTMSLERQVRIVAGTLVLSGALLGYFVNPLWIALSGFVGTGLIFAGMTDTCGMGMLLARMPWNNRKPAVVETSCSCATSR
jgi:rhodanese-related sulfurtransferase